VRPTLRSTLASLGTLAVLTAGCGGAAVDGGDTAAAPEGAGSSETPVDDDRPTADGDGTADTAEATADAAEEPADAGLAVTVGVDESGGDFRFTPDELRVSAGETVTFTNDGAAAHTVSGGGLNSGRLGPGDTYEVTFDEPGEIAYLCYFHPAMTGTVTVD
jgi:plastocyanin